MCQSKVQSIEAVRKEFKDEAGKISISVIGVE